MDHHHPLVNAYPRFFKPPIIRGNAPSIFFVGNYRSNNRYGQLNNRQKHFINKARETLGLLSEMQWIDSANLEKILANRGTYRSRYRTLQKIPGIYKTRIQPQLALRHKSARKIQTAWKKYKTMRNMYSNLAPSKKRKFAESHLTASMRSYNRSDERNKKRRAAGVPRSTPARNALMRSIREAPSRTLRLIRQSRNYGRMTR